MRFVLSGLAVVIVFVLAPYLTFCEPLVGAVDRVIGIVSTRLGYIFRHPLSDFAYGDPFGRFLAFAILILVPAMLLATLFCGLALAGALVWHRKG